MKSGRDKIDQRTTRLDRLLAWPMFCASLLFLLVTGAMLHLTDGDLLNNLTGVRCLICLAALYPLFVLEAVAHWLVGGRQMRQHIKYLVMPIMRVCPRDHVAGTCVWLPGLGWHETSRHFENYLLRLFSAPMIIIALLLLPMVVIEFVWFETISQSARWTFVMQTVTGWIWMAFVFEFVIMVSVVERKLLYCKKNWIDLAVILLPLLSFLRAARLSRLLKLKQLSRTARIYRLRGLALRTWRAIVALDVIDMLLRRDPEYRIEKLQAEIDEKRIELELMARELQQMKEKYRSAERRSQIGRPQPAELNGLE